MEEELLGKSLDFSSLDEKLKLLDDFELEMSVRRVLRRHLGEAEVIITSLVGMMKVTDRVDPALIMMVFEDAFEMLTIEESRPLFDILRESIDLLILPKMFADVRGKPKNKSPLVFLRICNRLLERLSVARETRYRGEILLLMAKALPLDERSGVNLSCSFHLDNTTLIENSNQESIPISDDEAQIEKSRVDFEFYKVLWGVQDFFRDPAQLNMIEKMQRFFEYIHTIFSMFETVHISKPLDESKENIVSAIHFPKYLSSYRLLNLQISDAVFRQHFLVQCLIIFQYMSHGAKKVPLVLSEEDKSKVLAFCQQAERLLLQASNSDFVSSIKKHLDREMYWMRWKDDNCKLVFAKERFSFAESISTDAPSKSASSSRPAMGSEELSRLWMFSDDVMENLQDGDRKSLTEFDDLAETIRDEDEECEPEETKSINDSKFQLRCFRILQKENIKLFRDSKGNLRNIFPNPASSPSLPVSPIFPHLFFFSLFLTASSFSIAKTSSKRSSI